MRPVRVRRRGLNVGRVSAAEEKYSALSAARKLPDSGGERVAAAPHTPFHSTMRRRDTQLFLVQRPCPNSGAAIRKGLLPPARWPAITALLGGR